MTYLKKFNENTKFYDMSGVYIEPVASSSDFSKFIDEHTEFGFDSNSFWDDMDMWSEGNLSSRFDIKWCKTVIAGDGGSYWENKKKYYPAILLLLETYELETIRFACDW